MSYVLLSLLVIAVAALASRLVVLPIQPLHGPLPPLSDTERALALRLEQHVRGVASVPHNTRTPSALEQTALYIEGQIAQLGLVPRAQAFEVDGAVVRNIEIVFEATQHAAAAQTLVIGAHYDSALDTPGANDNATGVAALIELAASLAVDRPVSALRLRLVFFVNEEEPYGKTEAMGSLRHGKALVASGETVKGMIALETLGYFPDRPGTQRLPVPFRWIYPDKGNFVAFVGLPGAGRFLRAALTAFRAAQRFRSTGTIVPAFVEGADLSDHWAYHQLGIPALMITDTAPYRNPFYHQPHDTPDTVDYASLARITGGLDEMVRALLR